MNSLVIVSGITPVTGLVVEALREGNEEVLVFNIEKMEFCGASPISIPTWIALEDDLAVSRWFASLVRRLQVERIMAVGMLAGSLACNFFHHKSVDVLLLPYDLDFSSRRKKMVDQFEITHRKSRSVIFFSEWEMYKAVSKGSMAQHFLWNPVREEVKPGIEVGGNSRVAIVYDGPTNDGFNLDAEALAPLRSLKGLGCEVDFISSRNAFFPKDRKIGRKIDDVINLRFRSYSHIVFVDSGADSLVLAAALSRTSQKKYAISTINYELLFRDHRGVSVASSSKIAAGICGDFRPESGDSVRKSGMQSTEGLSNGRTLREIDSILKNLDPNQWYWEDFAAEEKPWAIFLAVPPLEDRSNGARPQRVRNMYLELCKQYRVVHLSFVPNVLKRREKFILDLIDRKEPIAFIYGENSTTPVVDAFSLLQARDLIAEINKACNPPSCWFVRDLHWLDPNIKINGAISQDVLIKAGVKELQEMGRVFKSLVAPSVESAEMFKQLTGKFGQTSISDSELPPGVSSAHTHHVSELVPDLKIPTFVYAGGFSETYRMRGFLTAIRDVLVEAPGTLYFDILARSEDHAAVVAELSLVGLEKSPEVRLLTGELRSYIPRSSISIGVLMLESDYGAGSFPYKSVSYLESGFQVLCFESSPVHRRFGAYGVTIPVSREKDAIVSSVREICNGLIPESDFETAWQKEGWAMRVEEARTIGRR